MFATLKGLLGLGFLALAALSPSRTLPNHETEEGNVVYGWSTVGNAINVSTWEFDDECNLTYCYAAEGDTANQRMYNYAIRNLPIDEKDTYTVSATFTPDEDSDLNGERTYGIVCYYQDQDNYLIYWLQQKPTEWSGQFYGRLNGIFKSFAVDSAFAPGSSWDNAHWYNGEYYDLWWDQSICNHSALVGRRDALISTTVTLGVSSEWVGDVTRDGITKQCRKFTLTQEVEDEPFAVGYFYVAFNYDSGRPSSSVAVEGPFYTGVYSEAFSFGVDYHLEVATTDFAGNVATEIAALPPEVTSVDDILAIEAARVSYENLLEFKSGMSAEALAALDGAESKAAAYVDAVILALDPSSPTFVQDVAAAVDLYSGLNSWIQDKVSQFDRLVEMVQKANNPDEPDPHSSEPGSSSESVPPSEEPPASTGESSVIPTPGTDQPVTPTPVEPSEPAKKGCGGAVAATFIGAFLALGGVTILSFKKKHK